MAPGRIKEISNDPRVKQVTQLFAALGSGAGDLTQAFGVGAAVEVARNRAKSRLSNYFLNTPEHGGGTLRILRTKLSELPEIQPVN